MTKSENHLIKKWIQGNDNTQEKRQHCASWWTSTRPSPETPAPIPPKIEPKSDLDCRSNYQLNGNRGDRVTCKRYHRDVISKIQMVGNSRRPSFFGKKFPRRKNKKGIFKRLKTFQPNATCEPHLDPQRNYQ